MKFIYIPIMLLVLSWTTQVYANDTLKEIDEKSSYNYEKSSPTLAINSFGKRKGSEFVIDFDPGSSKVPSLNFDVSVGDAKLTTDSIKSCESTKTHIFMCKVLNENTLRVLVFSAPSTPLDITSIMRFTTVGKATPKVISDTLSVSDMKGNEINSVLF